MLSVKLPSSGPWLGKQPSKGASEFRFYFKEAWSSATLTVAIHIAVSKKWKKLEKSGKPLSLLSQQLSCFQTG